MAVSGSFTLQQQMQAQAGGNWPVIVPTDPYFYDVSLLLNGDGTNGAQNNTFTDSSSNNITLTRNGNLTQGSFNPYGNNWSNYFNGSSALQVPAAASLSFAGDFTWEAWVNLSAVPSSGNAASIIMARNTGTSNSAFQYGINNSGGTITLFATISCGSTDYNYNSSAISLTVGVWNHFAVVRSGTTVTGYLNGASIGTLTGVSGATNAPTVNPTIGNRGGPYNDLYLNGYISNLRMCNSAVYTSNFTPPTTPLIAIGGTALLTCQANRFFDASSNGAVETVYSGTPAVQPFSPFNPTSAYDVTTSTGSGYFSTSSYLNYGNYAQIGSNDFTWETWVYPILGDSPYGGGGNIFCNGGDGNGYFGMAVGLTGTAYGVAASFSSGSGWYSLSTGSTKPMNQWYHLAVTRSSGNIVVYVNGVATLTGSFSNSKTGSENFIGYYTNHSSNYDSFYGYLAGMRLVIGSVVYTGNFIPPTTPPANVTNTSLLPKFAAAGIYDYATQNNLQTVGNAQVSTSVKKYGTGSLSFDGSNSGLYMPPENVFAFGTGDYTIEFWVYYASTSASYVFIDMRGSSGSGTAPVIYMTGSVFYVGYSTTNVITTTPPSINTWHHIALCRSSGSTKLFIDGTQSGSTYSDSNNVSTAYYTTIGYYGGGGYVLNGYLDDVRVTSGYARYTANFTPPTAALPTY